MKKIAMIMSVISCLIWTTMAMASNSSLMDNQLNGTHWGFMAAKQPVPKIETGESFYYLEKDGEVIQLKYMDQDKMQHEIVLQIVATAQADGWVEAETVNQDQLTFEVNCNRDWDSDDKGDAVMITRHREQTSDIGVGFKYETSNSDEFGENVFAEMENLRTIADSELMAYPVTKKGWWR